MYKDNNYSLESRCICVKINLFLRKALCILLFCLLGTLQLLAVIEHPQISKLALEEGNTTIQEVLSTIEREKGYYFTYNLNQVDVSKMTTAQVTNQDITTILNMLFPDGDVAYTINDRHVVLYKNDTPNTKTNTRAQSPVPQQSRTITGTVVDERGDALIGVNILVSGTTKGVITDIDGHFTLSDIISTNTLTISYVGFLTQNISVGNTSNFRIILLEDSQRLEDLVVVGYGTQKKSTLTGSVATIGSEDIVATKSENTISNLQGKVTGLMIRQQTGEPGVFDNMVSIRGYGEPLVVIDGITRPSYAGTAELAQLNSDDIESVSILKDASASIYGMNAANGVIIVTTKKGQDGKARISYSNLLGMKMATGMEFTVDAYTYRVMANEMQRNIGAAPAYTDDILQNFKEGKRGYTDNNWVDQYLLDWAFQQQHNISVRGGTDKVKYFNSFGYVQDNGLLKGGNQYYRRFNFRSNVNAELAKGLNLSVSLSGRLDTRQAPRDDFQWVYKVLMMNDRGTGPYVLDNPDHLTAIAPENKNIVALMDPDIDGYRRYRNLQYQTIAELTYKVPFVNGLSLSLLASYDGLNNNESKLHKKYDLYNYLSDEFVVTNGAGTYWNSLRLNEKGYIRGQANYTQTFNDKHNLSLLGVAEMTGTRYDILESTGAYADIFTTDIINGTTASERSSNGKREFTRLAAYLGRANYDFDGKYLVEVVARYDGSYRYANSKRWVFFPSASVGWRVSEESFIKDNLTFVNNLKLRASYGESGRDAGDPFQYVAGYTAVSNRSYVFNDGALTTGMVPPGVVNDNLSWVTSVTSNVALDFDLFNGLIGGSVEYFQRKNTGLLATRIQSVPNTFGASFPDENINSNLNRGIDLTLTHRNNIGRDFSYSVSANFTYARLKTLHSERAPFSSQWDRWKNGNENRYTGRMWMYEWSGQYTSLQQYETAPLLGGTMGNSRMLPGSYKIVDSNGDGIIDGNDQVPNFWTFGAVNPPIQYGMTLTAKYKSFDFSALFQGAAGYTINYRNNDIWGYGRFPCLHEKYLDRWHTVNITDDPYNPGSQWISGYYPALRTNTNNTTDQNVIDIWRPNAIYLRMKSIEFGYNIPKNVLQSVNISSARIYVNGNNLLTFCRKDLRDADPERQERSYDANLAYPLMKSLNVGINVNF